MRYLLDTNILSAVVRGAQEPLSSHLQQVGNGAVCTSIIVAAELRYGVALRRSARLAERVETLLGAVDVVPLSPPADVIYGALRASLEHSGQPIGHNDLLIAAHALALGHTLVTDNVREFSRVPGLLVQNWLRD